MKKLLVILGGIFLLGLPSLGEALDVEIKIRKNSYQFGMSMGQIIHNGKAITFPIVNGVGTIKNVMNPRGHYMVIEEYASSPKQLAGEVRKKHLKTTPQP